MSKIGISPVSTSAPVALDARGGAARALEAPQEFLELLPIAIYACDAEGRFLWFNSRAKELWGQAPRQGDQAERFFDVIRLHLDGRVASHDQYPMARALASGAAVHGVEAVVERPDGARTWVVIHVDPVKDEDGKLLGAIACFHETTELHRANEDLRNRQQELEDFFENCAVGLHLVSEDGRILRANKAELELLGYAAEEYVGRPISDVHVDADVIADVLSRLKRGEELSNYPARLRAKDGSIKHVLITTNARFGDGAFQNTRCFTLDVTELKDAQQRVIESERHFRELVESLPAAIYMTDAEGRITYYNQAAVELWGRAPNLSTDRWAVSARIYRPDGTLLPPEEYPMAVAMREGRPIRDLEVIAERPDGTRVPIIPYPTPLHDSSGRVVGAVNMLIDISERKQSETQKHLLLDELNHRVKNKVQMLHSLLRMAIRKTSNSEAHAVLADVARRVAAIAAAQRVLYDARSPYSFDVQDLVRSVCADARQGLGSKVRIIHEADEGRLSNKSAMPVALILSELLTNAGKYGVNDRGETAVCVRLTKTADSYVLSVEDDGPGFEFTRATALSSGLGLVTGLARQLGGTFAVERGPGARCIVTFPRKDGN